jgi:glycosyltransferase involved in cell wall biosynthesis
MNILVFFTYKVSISDWEKAGILDREFKLYEQMLRSTGINYSFITYGDSHDLNYNFNKLNIHPLYEKINYSKRGFIEFLNSLRILSVFKQEIKNCTIIKTNQLNGAWVGILAKFIYKKKLIIRTGYDILYFSKMEKKSYLKIIFFDLLTNISLKFSDCYVVSSESDKERLILKYGPKYAVKIKVNANWVDYPNTVKPFSERDEEFISVGRLEKQKNYSNLLKSFTKKDFSIDIFGEGSEKKLLQKLIDEHDIQATLKGKIKNTTLQTKYQDYKYFILNSHYEGNPKALLEAMAAGCVVLVRYHSNLRGIITNKQNGFFYKSDEELEKTIMSLENYNLEKISGSARLYVHKNITLEQHIEKELQLYKNLVPDFSF